MIYTEDDILDFLTKENRSKPGCSCCHGRGYHVLDVSGKPTKFTCNLCKGTGVSKKVKPEVNHE